MRDQPPFGPTQPRTLAVLHFAGVRIALDQRDLGDLDSAAAVQGLGAGSSIGFVVNRDHRWPVRSLDASLRPLTGRDAARRICVMLMLDDGCMGLLVEDVTLLDLRQAVLHSLPEAMHLPGTPIRALLRVGDPGRGEGVIVYTDAAALARCAGLMPAPRGTTPAPASASVIA